MVTEQPGNVHPLSRLDFHRSKLRTSLEEQILAGVVKGVSTQQRARAAYLAICLDMAPRLADDYPDAWRTAIAALNSQQKLVTYLLSNRPDTAAHKQLKKRASAAGLVSRAE